MAEHSEKSAEELRKEKARDATRRWRAKNRERANALARESQRRWRAANPEKHRKRVKEWRENNYDRYIERHRRWRSDNRDHVNEYRRKQHFKHKYGMTLEERDAMLAAQGGRCAVCRSDNPGNKLGWVIDHCHSTGAVRGILCHRCNLTLGFVKDEASLLRRLADYLENHNGRD